jgi:four helix bundle protein
MVTERKNKNRGYKKLNVWNGAVDYYVATCRVCRGMPYDLKRIASQSIACADSVHRNIAEGYCRRSIKEYINFLYIALGSLGESVSGISAYVRAGQITQENFELLDAQAYRLENGLLKLVAALEAKRDSGEWTDSLSVRESDAEYCVGEELAS